MACVYKISCIDENIKDCYIGSTNNFSTRKRRHKSRSKNNFNHGNVYKFINEHGGWENWVMEKIEDVSEENRFIRERYYIENTEFTLNYIIPGRTREEWRQINKEKIRELHRVWVKNNREKDREKSRKYYQKNREKLKERYRKYYQKNREKENHRKSQKITCECGCVVRKDGISDHRKSKKHLELMSLP